MGTATTLKSIWERGRAEIPGLELSEGRFVEYWRARLEGEADLEAVDEERAGDLYLACACTLGKPGAVGAFEDRYQGHIRAILGRLKASPDVLDEATQRLREHLFVAREAGPPRIAEYRGRGELLAFVRVVAVRLALSLLRKRKSSEVVAPDEELWQVPADQDDPEMRFLKTHYRGECKRAFAEAVASLPPRARTLLRYHLVDQLNIDQIGAIYSVHRATAARWLEKAREAILDGTRAALMKQLSIDRDAFDSIMRLIQSNLDMSAERLLRASTEQAEQ